METIQSKEIEKKESETYLVLLERANTGDLLRLGRITHAKTRRVILSATTIVAGGWLAAAAAGFHRRRSKGCVFRLCP